MIVNIINNISLRKEIRDRRLYLVIIRYPLRDPLSRTTGWFATLSCYSLCLVQEPDSLLNPTQTLSLRENLFRYFLAMGAPVAQNENGVMSPRAVRIHLRSAHFTNG